MRELKDSGIEWIGNIPRDWDLKPIKYSFYISSGSTPQSTIPEYWDGDIRWITPADFKTLDKFISGGKRRITSKGFLSCGTKMVNPGTIILSKRAPIGSVVIASEKLCTNQGCLCCMPLNHAISTVYFYYLMSIYDDIFNLYGSGTTFKEISADTFGRLAFPVPSYNEQVLISKYLDSICKEIDSITADIQKEIATLQEYRKSVITEAVTKGLDKNVKMKDSGIEWCPSIPLHWDKTNPKALFKQRNQRAFGRERQLTASQKYGIVYQDEFMESEGTKVVLVDKDFSILKHVEPGDFVISMRSFQGGLEYSEIQGCISSAYVMLIPNFDYVYPPFYRWFFKSSKYINAIQSTSNLIRDGQAMRYANFAQVALFKIPIVEQKAIAAFLDAKCSEIDSIIEAKQKQLDTLAEYRKSLIYEYVTGKKEVPTV